MSESNKLNKQNSNKHCYEQIEDISGGIYPQAFHEASQRYNPLLSLHDVNHCHNVALSKLFKWYDLAFSQKNLILSVIRALQRDPTVKLDGLTLDNYEKIISDITQRVIKSLQTSVDKNNIGDLLSFDPFYVP